MDKPWLRIVSCQWDEVGSKGPWSVKYNLRFPTKHGNSILFHCVCLLYADWMRLHDRTISIVYRKKADLESGDLSRVISCRQCVQFMKTENTNTPLLLYNIASLQTYFWCHINFRQLVFNVCLLWNISMKYFKWGGVSKIQNIQSFVLTKLPVN